VRCKASLVATSSVLTSGKPRYYHALWQVRIKGMEQEKENRMWKTTQERNSHVIPFNVEGEPSLHADGVLYYQTKGRMPQEPGGLVDWLCQFTEQMGKSPETKEPVSRGYTIQAVAWDASSRSNSGVQHDQARGMRDSPSASQGRRFAETLCSQLTLSFLPTGSFDSGVTLRLLVNLVAWIWNGLSGSCS